MRKRKKYKVPFTQGRNIGLSFRSKYRAIYFQVILLLNKYKNEHGHVEINPDNYKELFQSVSALPELQEITDPEHKEVAVNKVIEFTVYKLFLNGDVTIGSIEKAECIMRHKELIEGAQESKDFKAALAGNRDLMEALQLVKVKAPATFEEGGMFGVRLTQKKDGTKDAIMIGTGSECISAIRNALRPQLLLEEVKENI